MNNVSALGKETFGSPGSGQAPAGCLPRAGALNPTVSRALVIWREDCAEAGACGGGGEGGGGGSSNCPEGWAGWRRGCRGNLRGAGGEAGRAGGRAGECVCGGGVVDCQPPRYLPPPGSAPRVREEVPLMLRHRAAAVRETQRRQWWSRVAGGPLQSRGSVPQTPKPSC